MTHALLLAFAVTVLWWAFLLPRTVERELAELRNRRGRYPGRAYLWARVKVWGQGVATALLGLVYLWALGVAWLWLTGREEVLRWLAR